VGYKVESLNQSGLCNPVVTASIGGHLIYSDKAISKVRPVLAVTDALLIVSKAISYSHLDEQLPLAGTATAAE